MTQLSQGSALGPSRAGALPVSELTVEEQSHVQLRALGGPWNGEQEDPFPLVRPASEAPAPDSDDLGIDVTFDHSRVSDEPPPVVETRPLYESIPVYAQAPEPVVPTYEEDTASASSSRSYRRGRAIASRVVAGLAFAGVCALLVYEIRILMASGTLPF